MREPDMELDPNIVARNVNNRKLLNEDNGKSMKDGVKTQQ